MTARPIDTDEPEHDEETGEVLVPEEGARSFSVFLSQLSDGEAESRLSGELHDLVKDLRTLVKQTHNKARGKLKLALILLADPNGTMTITYNVEATAPKPPTTGAVWWVTGGGNLSRSDTRQLELRPRGVSAPKKAPRAPAAQNVTEPKEV